MFNADSSLMKTGLKINKVISQKNMAEARIDAAADFLLSTDKDKVIHLLSLLSDDVVSEIAYFSKHGSAILESASEIEADRVIKDLSKSFEIEDVDGVRTHLKNAIIKNTTACAKKRAFEIVHRFVAENSDVEINDYSAGDSLGCCFIDLWFSGDYLINYDFYGLHSDSLTIEVCDASQDLHEEMSCVEYDALQKRARLQSLDLEKALMSDGFIIKNNL